jgi:hypothetical protein
MPVYEYGGLKAEEKKKKQTEVYTDFPSEGLLQFSRH